MTCPKCRAPLPPNDRVAVKGHIGLYHGECAMELTLRLPNRRLLSTGKRGPWAVRR